MRRRHVEQTPVMEVLRTYDPGHKVVLVGDASMSPYETTARAAASSAERRGRRCGCTAADAYPKAVAQPGAGEHWGGTTSIGMIRALMEDRMFLLTLDLASTARCANWRTSPGPSPAMESGRGASAVAG